MDNRANAMSNNVPLGTLIFLQAHGMEKACIFGTVKQARLQPNPYPQDIMAVATMGEKHVSLTQQHVR